MTLAVRVKRLRALETDCMRIIVARGRNMCANMSTRMCACVPPSLARLRPDRSCSRARQPPPCSHAFRERTLVCLSCSARFRYVHNRLGSVVAVIHVKYSRKDDADSSSECPAHTRDNQQHPSIRPSVQDCVDRKKGVVLLQAVRTSTVQCPNDDLSADSSADSKRGDAMAVVTRRSGATPSVSEGKTPAKADGTTTNASARSHGAEPLTAKVRVCM